MFKAFRKRLFSLNGDERGFTIVELLVVITIVGILAGVGISGYRSFQDRAYKTAADAAWRDLQVAISLYEAEHGADTFPRWELDGDGAVEAAQPAEVLVKAVAEQLIPPPEPLRRDMWIDAAIPEAPDTGFVVVETPTETYSCVWVNGQDSRFNHDDCDPVNPADA